MRALSIAFSLTLMAASPALAQTTWCNPIGGTVVCNTTPAPQPNYQTQNSMGMFGAALGERIRDRRERRPDASSLAEVRAFAADPANPYYGLVREDMARIIETGRAQTLRDAYDLAVSESPAVRRVRGY